MDAGDDAWGTQPLGAVPGFSRLLGPAWQGACLSRVGLGLPGLPGGLAPCGSASCLLLEVGGAGDRAPTLGGVRPLTAAGQEACGWRRSWSHDSGSAAMSVWGSVLPPPSVQIHTLT